MYCHLTAWNNQLAEASLCHLCMFSLCLHGLPLIPTTVERQVNFKLISDE